jgi:hypothetical protein
VTKAQLENKANDVLARVTARQPIEDSYVECKTDWPDEYPRAARQLAGSANAARWEPVTWLIGVDERNAAVPGAIEAELSNWYARVQAEFDGVAPALLMSIAVRWNSVTVVALLFETDRPPYVVKMGPGRMDVPLREGNGTRSAYRSELLRLLAPFEKQPEIESIGCRLSVRMPKETTGLNDWHFSLHLYVVPRSANPIVIPYHRCRALFRLGTKEWRSLTFRRVSEDRKVLRWPRKNAPPEPDHPSLKTTDREAFVSGPVMINVTGGGVLPSEALDGIDAADLHVRLRMTDSDQPLAIDQHLTAIRSTDAQERAWGWHVGPPNEQIVIS